MTSVLLVEDDEIFAKAVSRDLAESGYQVFLAKSVGEALDELSGHAIDVLLTDLQLGAEDGIGLLESLPAVSPRTRSVLMSGLATARDYQRAIELGAVGVLCKPFNPPDLIQCVQQAVECETGFRGSVHGLSLVDIIQMFNYGRRSVSITVQGPSTARLHMREGQIVHAEHRGLVGEEAVRSILAMPTGALSTSVLGAGTPRTVTRDCREVLLDAFRALDEGTFGEASGGASDDGEVELIFDVQKSGPIAAAVASVLAPVVVPHEQTLRRLRELDGYLGACVAHTEDGRVLSHDGALDLRSVAPLTAQVIRVNQRTVDGMGLDDQVEDMLVTGAEQYHLIRQLASVPATFLHLVLDRRAANPSLARLALASALRFG